MGLVKRLAAAALLALSLAAPASAGGARHLAVIAGIGGEPFYDDLFHRWASTLTGFASDELGIEPGHIHYLRGAPSDAAADEEKVSSKTTITALLNRLAVDTEPDDLVLLVLIGHGSAREERVLFNIEGPDVSAEEFARMLAALDGRRVALVNAASSSGPFVKALSRPGRVVITATSSASENLHPMFGGQFATALTSAADADKDERLSIAEVFSYATARVGESFERERRIRTEHALLDDNGDGVGSRDLDGTGDGALAARWYLTPTDSRLAGERARTLAAEAQQLVDRIGQLKRRKREMPEPEYFEELEQLLVALALNRRSLREGEEQP